MLKMSVAEGEKQTNYASINSKVFKLPWLRVAARLFWNPIMQIQKGGCDQDRSLFSCIRMIEFETDIDMV